MDVMHHPRSDIALDAELDLTRTYQQTPGPKPCGLWLSVDDDWRRWCTDEDWGIEAWFSREPWRFTLDTDRCLWLKTPTDIDDFTAEHVGPESIDHFQINWQSIADEYAGLIIAPYQWSRRLDLKSFWYYGWDCASACVWDLSALTSVKQEVDA